MDSYAHHDLEHARTVYPHDYRPPHFHDPDFPRPHYYNQSNDMQSNRMKNKPRQDPREAKEQRRKQREELAKREEERMKEEEERAHREEERQHAEADRRRREAEDRRKAAEEHQATYLDDLSDDEEEDMDYQEAEQEKGRHHSPVIRRAGHGDMDFSDDSDDDDVYNHTAQTDHITYDDLRGYRHEFPSPHSNKKAEGPENGPVELEAPQFAQNSEPAKE